MHMRYFLEGTCRTAGTDGSAIFFAPAFLSRLNERETEFVLLHEILHVALAHCFRGQRLEPERFNIACDIVVNDTIIDELGYAFPDGKIASLALWSKAPDGKSGSLYNAEQVYNMLGKLRPPAGGIFQDNHSMWSQSQNSAARGQWHNITIQAALAAERRSAGALPLLARRLLQNLRQPRVDWRRLLHHFITPEVFDYSFSQPDRRYQDSLIIMPDLCQTRDHINVWIAVDTSASVSDGELAQVLSEIRAAAHMFTQAIKVSFFDAGITEPIDFSTNNMNNIQPKGGGGTDFFQIFTMLDNNRKFFNPDCVVIVTDGYAPFPPKSAARGTPVLWLLNNPEAKPPWGKIARF